LAKIPTHRSLRLAHIMRTALLVLFAVLNGFCSRAPIGVVGLLALPRSASNIGRIAIAQIPFMLAEFLEDDDEELDAEDGEVPANPADSGSFSLSPGVHTQCAGCREAGHAWCMASKTCVEDAPKTCATPRDHIGKLGAFQDCATPSKSCFCLTTIAEMCHSHRATQRAPRQRNEGTRGN
jgi:hypothetical protein